MENHLFGIENLDIYLVLGVLVLFGLLETSAGFLKRTQRNIGDWVQEFGGFLVLSLLIKPAIVLAVLAIGQLLVPSYGVMMSDWSLWIALPLYLLPDDLLQYGYHRWAHENPFLWKLHRTHHQAEEMGFFVSYRNAALYYLLMPNIWWVGIFTFLGAGKAVALGLVLKQFVIIGSHSTLKWDKPLYENRILRPLALLLERIIITPAFHHAHHGKSKVDGISDPNGNFGNMFSLWDQLFGTAIYTHQFPIAYGLQKETDDHWTAAYLYPLVTSGDARSDLARGYENEITASLVPVMVELVEGKKYLWCRCGRSKTQPFCDGSHHGTSDKPLVFQAKRNGKVRLCNCKLTQKGPFCDNSHITAK